MVARKTQPRIPATVAELAAMPIQHTHAAGIDVGDTTHWVCVDATPDGTDTVREFPAHTPGLRELVDWLRQCGVTTVALEASGVYGHVLDARVAGHLCTVRMSYPASYNSVAKMCRNVWLVTCTSTRPA